MACNALGDVLLDGQRLDVALSRMQAALDGGRERALARELVTGVVRWYERLDGLITNLLSSPLKDPALALPLLLGAYQMAYTRIPPHAAVSTSVALAGALGFASARGLVNGVLRRFGRERDTLLPTLDASPRTRWSLPQWLIEELETAWPDDATPLLTACNARAALTLRVNATRTTRADYLARLAASGLRATQVPCTRHGLALESGAEPRSLPGYDDGEFSIQDGASQLVVDVLAPRPGERILDACAAPGGKSAALIEACPDIELTALEIEPARLAVLETNLRRLGLHVMPLCADALHPEKWWDGRGFDRILIDAPCSATGIIRRHPDIKLRRSPADVLQFAAQQRALLDALWPLLVRGGTLVYATCSVLPAENAQTVSRFLSATEDAVECPIDGHGGAFWPSPSDTHLRHGPGLNGDPSPASPAGAEPAESASWGRSVRPGRQILTGELGMDGFYYASLAKR